MAKKASNKTGKWNNIGIDPATDRKVEAIAEFRGQAKKTVVVRAIDREFTEFEREQSQSAQPAQPATA